jgi:hypothetical protein
MPQTPDPTPREIRKLCLEIQSTWTKAEERRRRVVDHEPITAETVAAEALFGESDRGG